MRAAYFKNWHYVYIVNAQIRISINFFFKMTFFDQLHANVHHFFSQINKYGINFKFFYLIRM